MKPVFSSAVQRVPLQFEVPDVPAFYPFLSTAARYPKNVAFVYQGTLLTYVAKILYDGYKDIRWCPNILLEQLVLSGDLGRKTGKGWYDYTSGEMKPRTDIEI